MQLGQPGLYRMAFWHAEHLRPHVQVLAGFAIPAGAGTREVIAYADRMHDVRLGLEGVIGAAYVQQYIVLTRAVKNMGVKHAQGAPVDWNELHTPGA